MKKCLRLIAIVLVLASLLTYPAMAADAALPGITLTTPNGNVTFDVGIPEGAFSGSTAAYNHELAQTSMVLSYAAANSTDDSYGAETAVKALKAIGFVDAKTNDPDSDDFTLNYAYGTQVLDGKTIIAVVFDDAHTVKEWTDAYDFGTGNTVQMFSESANAALSVVTALIPEDGSDYCFWVTGFGRGGSSANLLGKLLTDAHKTHRVCAYSFAAPAVSTNAESPVNTSKYNNLFTINNPDDIVWQFPMAAWGYSHYGVYIEQNHYVDSALKNVILEKYQMFSTDQFSYYSSASAVKEHIEYLATNIAPTINDYHGTSRNAYNYTINNLASFGVALSLGFAGSPELVQTTMRDLLTNLFVTFFTGDSNEDYYSLLGIILGIYVHGKENGHYEDKSAWPFEKELSDNPFYRTVRFAMTHGLGVNSLKEASLLMASYMNNVSEAPFKELVTSSEPETYLAWMMATSNISELSSTKLPTASPMLEDEDTGIVVEGDGVFYGDITLEAKVEDGGYSVALKRTSDNTQITAYGPVTISLPLPAENAKVYYETAGSQPVEISYEQIKEGDQLYARFNDSSWSGGTYKLTVPATESYINITDVSDSTLTYSAANINDEEHRAVLYLAAYGENDQMIDVQELGSLEVEQEVAEETIAIPSGWVSIKIFMLDSVSYAPLCEAADYPTQ